MAKSSEISIPEFYGGKSVFLTGGMGFLGKVIVEKLLRSCPQIENIYLLVRSKKGKSVSDRLHELIESPAFNLLRESNPKAFEKIVMIEGDVSEDELGMSKADQQLLAEKVSIFIHSAATIKFNEPLKVAVRTNLKAVQSVLDLARRAQHVNALVHVSTAYTNWFEFDNEKKMTEEKIYPSMIRQTPEEILHMSETMPEAAFNGLKETLLGKHTNTYTFTKNLAERLVVNAANEIPVTIVRPSMVMGSLKEPMPGWIDSWAGPTTYGYLLGMGFLRSFNVHKNNIAEVIPVDTTVNLILASAWKAGTDKRATRPLIYHSSTGTNPINWKRLFDSFEINAKKYPLDNVFWYPRIRYRATNFATKLDAFFTQIIPAHVIDLALVLTGRKPKMVKLQKKIENGYKEVKFTGLNPIRFECKNYEGLMDTMKPGDIREFDFDVRRINWTQYTEDYFKTARKYVFNSKSEDFTAGRRKMMRLKYANYCLVGTSLAASLYLLNEAKNFVTNEKSETSKPMRKTPKGEEIKSRIIFLPHSNI